MTQKPQSNQPSDLPGHPFVKDQKSGKMDPIVPGRVLRGRDGKHLLLRNSFIGKGVCATASKFVGCAVVPVHFQNGKGVVIEAVGMALAGGDGNKLMKGGMIAIEAMTYFANNQHEREKARVKKVLTAERGIAQ